MASFRPLAARRLLCLPIVPTGSSRSWVCASCRHGATAARSRFSTSPTRRFESAAPPKLSGPPEDKPFYVTTPIFYVNAAPHIGHLYSMILGDVLKRWHTLSGRPSILSTGTDEHGLKVQQAAARDGRSPQEFCDDNADKFRQLAAAANLAHDHFVRTTDPDHIVAVRHFWHQLQDQGYIYESTHSGWYCVSDECFYPEAAVEKRFDPPTGRTIMASVETGNEVEWTVEKNYHFRMTALKHRLLEFYEANPTFVQPPSRMAEVVSWVKNNLEDLSVSRPADRLDWGIRVPGDSSQTIYVWVDALINYLTKAGYPAWAPGEEHIQGWPASVHVVGKDILRFHAVYWPALLMAVNLPPPQQVLGHGHWIMGGRKMSKSLGNVVNPFFALDRWGVDVLRFFLVAHGGFETDRDYANELVLTVYKKQLQANVGNLSARLVRTNAWKPAEVVQRLKERQTGDVRQSSAGIAEALRSLTEELETPITAISGKPLYTPSQYSEFTSRVYKHLIEVRDVAAKEYERLDPRNATLALMEPLAEVNKMLTHLQPWDDPGEELRDWTIFLGLEALRICGILLQPIMPSKMPSLLDELGVDPARRRFQDAELFADMDYGKPFMVLREKQHLFPKPITEK